LPPTLALAVAPILPVVMFPALKLPVIAVTPETAKLPILVFPALLMFQTVTLLVTMILENVTPEAFAPMDCGPK